MMPRIAEIREFDGKIWCQIDIDAPHGSVTLLTQEEIKEVRQAAVRDFLIDLFQAWKDKL